jgi:hypothetical protein
MLGYLSVRYLSIHCSPSGSFGMLIGINCTKSQKVNFDWLNSPRKKKVKSDKKD